MQKAYYLSIPLLARSRTPVRSFISACMRARVCVCQNEDECMREREREGGSNSRAVDS